MACEINSILNDLNDIFGEIEKQEKELAKNKDVDAVPGSISNVINSFKNKLVRTAFNTTQNVDKNNHGTLGRYGSSDESRKRIVNYINTNNSDQSTIDINKIIHVKSTSKQILNVEWTVKLFDRTLEKKINFNFCKNYLYIIEAITSILLDAIFEQQQNVESNQKTKSKRNAVNNFAEDVGAGERFYVLCVT